MNAFLGFVVEATADRYGGCGGSGGIEPGLGDGGGYESPDYSLSDSDIGGGDEAMEEGSEDEAAADGSGADSGAPACRRWVHTVACAAASPAARCSRP